jgi:cytochrome c peroxidase
MSGEFDNVTHSQLRHARRVSEAKLSFQQHWQATRMHLLLVEDSLDLSAHVGEVLRDVARTAPYMHDGRFANLEQVMKFYGGGAPAGPGCRVGVR